MMAATRFRKKPVEVQAIQWTGDNAAEIKAFVGVRENGECRFLQPHEITGVWDNPHVFDELHATWVPVLPENWIIRGVQGEFYPCDADVFAASYNEVAWWR